MSDTDSQIGEYDIYANSLGHALIMSLIEAVALHQCKLSASRCGFTCMHSADAENLSFFSCLLQKNINALNLTQHCVHALRE